MEHLCIRKILLGLFECSFLSIAFLSCVGQKINQPLKDGAHVKMTGKYQQVKGNERMILNDDQTFICLRNYMQKSDVVVPLCDTLAAGFWDQQKTFITLKSSEDFNKIDYSISAAEIGSKDSLYFKIILPEEDALDYKKFKFSIIPQPLYGQFQESGTPEFAIPNKMRGSVTFGLTIHNIAPNCDYGRKCYQRVYFNVFEGYRPQNVASNFFTITLKKFNQCFYEAMDIDREIIGIEGNSLFWRGNIYKKIN